ncbi:hypothetical protein MNV49_003733 [Pseudohyphozyma bogoriensis]|nr:hypothetical protein MNV49_003733 [Pseudohyphozyma bogoriensis]
MHEEEEELDFEGGDDELFGSHDHLQYQSIQPPADQTPSAVITEPTAAPASTTAAALPPSPQSHPQSPAVAPAVTRTPTPPPKPEPKPHDKTLDAFGRPLPAGWISKVSTTSGDIYYRNLVANTTCWDIPTEPAEKKREKTRTPTPPRVVNAPEEQKGSGAVEQQEPVVTGAPLGGKKIAVHPSRMALVQAADDSTSTDYRQAHGSYFVYRDENIASSNGKQDADELSSLVHFADFDSHLVLLRGQSTGGTLRF